YAVPRRGRGVRRGGAGSGGRPRRVTAVAGARLGVRILAINLILYPIERAREGAQNVVVTRAATGGGKSGGMGAARRDRESSMKVIEANDVHRVLEFRTLIEALRRTFGSPAGMPQRLMFRLDPDGESRDVFALLPSWNGDGMGG